MRVSSCCCHGSQLFFKQTSDPVQHLTSQCMQSRVLSNSSLTQSHHLSLGDLGLQEHCIRHRQQLIEYHAVCVCASWKVHVQAAYPEKAPQKSRATYKDCHFLTEKLDQVHATASHLLTRSKKLFCSSDRALQRRAEISAMIQSKSYVTSRHSSMPKHDIAILGRVWFVR